MTLQVETSGAKETAAGRRTRARALLDADGVGVDELVRLSNELSRNKDFELSRRLLVKARQLLPPDSERDLDLRQKQAVRTYKDPECAAEQSLQEALTTLRGVSKDELIASLDEETLGIAGAIHKRLWEVDGRLQHLRDARSYYTRGWELGSEGSNWYTGINAAFVLDLIAQEEKDPEEHALLEQKAAEIRGAIVDLLPAEPADPDLYDWWLWATVVEAHFGLGDYGRARDLLDRFDRSVDLRTLPDWELESTVRQLAALERISPDCDDSGRNPKAVKVVDKLVGGDASHVMAAFGGKLGVALSGGGFRASFFHLGVLARLAELDVLRHVEVLSCVSGGAIAGAQYYLRLRPHLVDVPDGKMSRDVYLGVVREVQDDLIGAVKANIRSKALFGPGRLVGWLAPGHDRRSRVARLLDEHLFKKANGGKVPRLVDLIVQPDDEQVEFNPKCHNWRRSAKVPVLVLNATTLNTGHNWQFTATWMGEPPSAIESEVDVARFLPRIWLQEEAPHAHRDIELSTAVAASACVPGAFPPVVLEGLYEGVSVHLVDGGLQDNQGVYGLLEQDCRLLLVSDASAQKDATERKVWNPWNVLLRSNTVAMGTVRTGSYRQLGERQRSSRLKALWYLHLGKGLEGPPVQVVGAMAEPPATTPNGPSDEMTDYGMPKPVQRRLALLRTDLDVFSEREADALMLSGYRMATWCLRESGHPLVADRYDCKTWRFTHSLDSVLGPSSSRRRYQRFLRDLDAGRHRWFRTVYRRLGRFRSPDPEADNGSDG